ncbi:DUF402 domain-containing protein [Paractinoplanes brasiliensis]|uniref:Uncharacterized protein DUF402 n=1 Tax=Paractinoplanes brasiliensis TaxID=52695 RepID=A0A4R6K0M9_9ACTN|nr:DUF402 domain-containing protein [Actinoplanes brasiliensis]TDO40695.1 uncharacterized protein DUF402 [Actinoplanes brasiliensis]GID25766.1 hypothetical protein Abr02nite_07490 [Actinoplanes brasiliensis]
MRFEPGRLVLHRDTHHGRIAFVHPSRVVSDDDRGLLLWLARGSVVAVERSADGRGPRDMPFAEWGVTPVTPQLTTWQGPGVLRFFPTGADHSVWLFRTDEGAFTRYYVNLEESAVRWDDGTIAGIDVIDQDLDIVATPDPSTGRLAWQWKDEDEFSERLAHPDLYWVPDEQAVWTEGFRVIKMIEAADFPFDGTWTDFQPDPSWITPSELPPGWDRPVAARS